MLSALMRDTSDKDWRAAFFFFGPLNQIRLIAASLSKSSKIKTKSLRLDFRFSVSRPHLNLDPYFSSRASIAADLHN